MSKLHRLTSADHITLISLNYVQCIEQLYFFKWIKKKQRLKKVFCTLYGQFFIAQSFFRYLIIRRFYEELRIIVLKWSKYTHVYFYSCRWSSVFSLTNLKLSQFQQYFNVPFLVLVPAHVIIHHTMVMFFHLLSHIIHINRPRRRPHTARFSATPRFQKPRIKSEWVMKYVHNTF